MRHLEIHVPEQINVDEHIRTALNHALDLPADAPFGAALARPLAELPRWITVHLPPGGEGFERSLHDPGNSNFRRIHWCTQRPNFGT